MDTPTGEENAGAGQVPGLSYSPDVEATLQHWQQTGIASLGPFHIDLSVLPYSYNLDDLRLLHHVLSSDHSPQSRQFTVMISTSDQVLSAAQSHPFLVYAVLAFAAFSISFEHGSAKAKGLAYHYGGIALQSLQEAIGAFSMENADAVLLASLLLAWQANDWRSWMSLTSGIRTVVNSTKSFQSESFIPHVIADQDSAIPQTFPQSARPPMTEDFYRHYSQTLQNALMAVNNLMPWLAGRQRDSAFIEQLRDYVARLLGVRPADSPEDQFKHLYVLRKWLFFVPSISMREGYPDGTTLVVIAHFYALALEMYTLFPNVAPAFCCAMSERPLEEIFTAFEEIRMTNPSESQQLEWQLNLMVYPRQAAARYNSRKQNQRDIVDTGMVSHSFDGYLRDLAFTAEGVGIHAQRSPALTDPSRFQQMSHTPSSAGSPFLELPVLPSDSSSSTPGGVGPPYSAGPPYQSTTGLSPMPLVSEPEEEMAGFGNVSMQFTSGLVFT
ncbi:MAG: hypothetical protein M1831_001007 [Alyxoria varia]|nr:MAG: hypothetical protein M1831_001007 [Alyxoria varia]